MTKVQKKKYIEEDGFPVELIPYAEELLSQGLVNTPVDRLEKLSRDLKKLVETFRTMEEKKKIESSGGKLN